MDPLRGVVIGTGYFSQFHLDAWNRIDDVILDAVCDLDAERAATAAEQYQVSHWYTDVDRMLAERQPDFVDIVTRPATHLPLVHQVAGANRAIICQKPVADTLAEAEQLVTTATEQGSRLMIHDNFRFQPWYREMRRLLDSGVVGKQIMHIAIRTRMGDGWQADAYQQRQPYFREMPQLLVFETGVHFLDVFRFLAGEVDSVYARLQQRNPGIEGEDAGQLFLNFQNGATALWDASRYHDTDADNPRYTFGKCWLEADGGTIRLADDGTLTVQPLGQPPRKHDYRPRTHGFAGDCVLATQQHFVQQLRSNEPFETSGEDYLRTLHVQEAVYRSSETNQVVPVDFNSSGEHA